MAKQSWISLDKVTDHRFDNLWNWVFTPVHHFRPSIEKHWA